MQLFLYLTALVISILPADFESMYLAVCKTRGRIVVIPDKLMNLVVDHAAMSLAKLTYISGRGSKVKDKSKAKPHVAFTNPELAPVVKEGGYDLIIIPVLRSRIEELQKQARTQKNRKNDKLDMEHYDELTMEPDIDNFDYKEPVPVKKSQREGSYEQINGDDKIVGGAEVDIDLYPYHVAYGTNCGGAIIDKKWVVSAGHCGKKPYIRVGSKYLNKGKKVAVKSTTIHPMWFAKNKDHPFDYDFQLLELAEPLTFNDNIQPIKIAHLEDMVIGKVITVTGWGNTEENGPYSSVLRAIRVPIISKENCQTVPFPYFRGTLTSRMFCAGFSEGKIDACQGDSGGPAVANDRLVGMVSFGYGCATPGSYGVYSKIAKVRDWIESVTGIKLL